MKNSQFFGILNYHKSSETAFQYTNLIYNNNSLQDTNMRPTKHIKDHQLYKLLQPQAIQYYFKNQLYKKIPPDQLNLFSIIDENDKDRKQFEEIFAIMKEVKSFSQQLLGLSMVQSRAVASILGLAITDALGASTQFLPFDKTRKGLIVEGFADIQILIEKKKLKPRNGQLRIWTDDASMALCILDSILLTDYKFDPVHVRYMFHMWLFHGLNNGGRQASIGLGGNIKISMEQYMFERNPYAMQGDKFNNGNGSLMRLSPIPVAYHANEELAMKYAEQQSKTTHNGQQAKQCSRLLSLLQGKNQNWKQILIKACNNFETTSQTVLFLAKGMQQSKQLYNIQKQKYGEKFTKYNKSIEDRNWNWKDQKHNYSPLRTKQQPQYIGSYCMDALAMALHIVWYTKSFTQAAIWSANMGGDCDTVGAIAGQIAGATYGLDEGMLKLYSQMVDFRTGKYQVFLKAYKISCGKHLIQ